MLSNKYDPKTKVYLDSGDQGDGQDDKTETLTVKSHLEKIGYSSSGQNANLFYYLDKGGQHNEYYWGKRFHIPLKNLFSAAPKVWNLILDLLNKKTYLLNLFIYFLILKLNRWGIKFYVI